MFRPLLLGKRRPPKNSLEIPLIFTANPQTNPKKQFTEVFWKVMYHACPPQVSPTPFSQHQVQHALPGACHEGVIGQEKELDTLRVHTLCLQSRAARRGGFKRGGLPDLGLSFLFCPFLNFLGLSRFFRDFSGLSGDRPGIFPICLFPLSLGL